MAFFGDQLWLKKFFTQDAKVDNQVRFLEPIIFIQTKQKTTLPTNNQNMSITTLGNFVRELNDVSLHRLLTELDINPKPYSVYLKRTKEDWKEFYGINGVDIFNHLHPQEGNLIKPQDLFANIILH